MSRFLDRVEDAAVDRSRRREDWDSGERPFHVVTVTSNKGGVGKTTVACNLAVYIRALREDLPVLLMGFDDQPMIDWMFSLEPHAPERNVVSSMRSGSFKSAIRLGQYGVHYVPPSAEASELKRRIAEPYHLQTVLHRTGWRGLVIIDTKSDMEILTRNAIAASDLTLVVVKDALSLNEAQRVFDLLRDWGEPRERARLLLSMVDLRVKFNHGERKDILALLLGEIRRRGYPLFETFISSTPKIESLYTNPEERALPVLTGAPKSIVHTQMRHVAEEVLAALAAPRPAAEDSELAPAVDLVPEPAALEPTPPKAPARATASIRSWWDGLVETG